MSDEIRTAEEESARPVSKSVSRREFLRMAGIAGVMLGTGAGMGGFVAACGGTDETATTATPSTSGAAQASTTAAPATTAAQASTTAASAGGEQGRPLKVGVCTPTTGAMAVAAIADKWWSGHAAAATADGIVCADKKVRKIEIILRDNQSDSNRASQITSDMIMNDDVDIVLAYGWPDGVTPAADQCEALGTPGLLGYSPWQAVFARDSTPKEGYKWIWGHLMGAELTVNCFVPMFDTISTNKRVGMLFANDADAQGWMHPTAAPAVFGAAGYELVVPTYYNGGTEDFTAQISMYKKQGCEIVCGTNNPPDFINFWKQAYQQGFRPKIVSTGKALNFVEVVEAVGDIGAGLVGEMVWNPSMPFKDSLTGQTLPELAADFEATQKMQWRYPIGYYKLFEWAVDVFKRAENPEDKESVVAVIPKTKLDTIAGPIDFTEAVDSKNAHCCVNNVRPWLGCGQWVKSTGGQWKYDAELSYLVTGACVAPSDTGVKFHKLEALQYSS